MSPVMELVVRQRDGSEVARWPLAAGEYTFGASADNDLRIDARGVSGKHARVFVEDDAAFIEDIGSRFGTHQGGLPIEGRTRFTIYRPVEIGDLLLTATRIERRGKPNLPVATINVSVEQSADPAVKLSAPIVAGDSSGEVERAVRPSSPEIPSRRLLLVAGAILLLAIVLAAAVAAATAIFFERRFPKHPEHLEAARP